MSVEHPYPPPFQCVLTACLFCSFNIAQEGEKGANAVSRFCSNPGYLLPRTESVKNRKIGLKLRKVRQKATSRWCKRSKASKTWFFMADELGKSSSETLKETRKVISWLHTPTDGKQLYLFCCFCFSFQNVWKQTATQEGVWIATSKDSSHTIKSYAI